MKSVSAFLCVLCLLFLISSTAIAQIQIHLPDTTALAGSTVEIPLHTGEVSITSEVQAYQAIITYDPALANCSGYTMGSMIPPGWVPVFNLTVPGSINGGAFMTMPAYLSGEGVLNYLTFDIAEGASGECALHFESFIYNDGIPETVTIDGMITIVGPPEPFGLLTPSYGDTAWTAEQLLTWEETFDPDPFDDPHYDVWAGNQPDLSDAWLIGEDVAETEFLFSGLDDDMDYYWTVRATDSNTPGTWADDTLMFRTYIPEPPSAFALSAPANGSTANSYTVEVSWTESSDPDPGDEVSYQVEWSLDPGFTSFDYIVTTELSYIIEDVTQLFDNLPDDAEIFWRVKAVDGYGLETYADPGEMGWSFSINVFQAPTAFGLLTPLSGDTAWVLEAVLSWEESTDPDPYDVPSYDVWVGTEPDLSGAWLAAENIAETEFQLTGLDDDMEYYWTVRATDSNTAGTWASDTLMFRTYILEPPSAFALSAPADGDTMNYSTVTVSWTESVDPDPGDEISYQVEWTLDPTFASFDYAVTSDLEYLIEEVSPLMDELPDSSDIYWRVKAFDGYGMFTYADPGETGWSFYMDTSVPPIAIILPDTTALAGTTIEIPLYTGEVFDYSEVQAYQTIINYDSELASCESFTVGPVVPAGWVPIFNFGEPGVINGGAFMTMPSYLTGEGILNYFTFEIAENVSGVCELQFESFMYNDGIPVTVTFDGSITVYAPPGPFGLLTPEFGDTAWASEQLLTWEESFDPDPFDDPHYDVWVGNEPDLSDAWLAAENVAETEFMFSGYDDNMEYYWTVRATDSNTAGTWADDTLMFQTYILEPPAAFALSSPDNGSTANTYTVEVSWTESSDPDPGDEFSYQVEWSLDPDFISFDYTVTTELSYIIEDVTQLFDNLPDDAEIFWRVQAVDGYGMFTYADPGESGWSFNIDVFQAPAAFGLLTPEYGDTTWVLEQELTWEETSDPDPNDVPHYDVWLGNEPDLSGAWLAAENIPETEFLLTGLDDDMEYYWTVRATDSNTPGTWANDTLMFQTYILEPPAAFALESPDNGSTANTYTVEVSWTESSDPDPGDEFSYQVEWSLDPDFISFDYTVTTELSYIIEDVTQLFDNLPDDAEIFWRVQAVDGYGMFTYADPGESGWSFNIDVFQAPAAFGLLTPEYGDTTWVLEQELTWEETSDPDPNDVPHYDVWVGTTPNLSNAWLAAEDIPETDLLVTSLDNNTFYYWTVRATDSNTPGTWADDTSMFYIHLPEPPGTFSLLDPGNGHVMNTDTVTVSWSQSVDPDPGDAVYYEVQWTLDQTFSVFDSDITDETYYSITDVSSLFDELPDDAEVYWRVKAVDTFDLFTWANPGSGGWSFTIGIAEAPSAFGLTTPEYGDTAWVMEAELVWEAAFDPDPGAVVHYDVWVGMEPDLSDADLAAEGITEADFMFDGLEDDMTYYWTVMATDDNTPGTWADDTSMFRTYLPEPPGMFSLYDPGNARTVNTDEVTVTWTASTDPDPGDEFIYQLQWSLDPLFADYDFIDTEETTYTITDLSTLLDNLPDDITVYWRVKAEDGFGLFRWANPGADGWSFIVDVIEAPVAFGLLAPENGGTNWTPEAILEWEASNDPDPYDTPHYDVWVGNEPDLLNAWLAADSIAETMFGLSDLDDDTDYYWSVRATDSNSPGTWADETFMFSTYFSEAPGAFELDYPEDGTTLNEYTVEVSWTEAADPDPGDEILYQVEWSLDPAFGEFDFGTTSELSYVIEDISTLTDELPDDATFFWRVKAVDSFELFTWADPGDMGWSFNIDVFQSPDPFGLLSPALGDTCWGSDTLLVWEVTTDPDPYDVPAYDVWVGTDAGLSDGWLAAEGLADAAYWLTGLEDAGIYYWTVYATDSNTPGTWAEDTLYFYTNPYAGIEGLVTYYMGAMEPVPEVDMTLTGFLDEVVMTDFSGFYSFDNLFIGNDYTVKPSKLEPDYVSPIIISLGDAVLAAQGAAGLADLTAEQIIAADVEGGTGLNFFDAVKISQYAVQMLPQFSVADSNNSDWAFVPAEIEYFPLTGNMSDDYAAILYGDPSGNWTSAFTTLASGYDEELIGEYWISEDIITVPIMVKGMIEDVYYLQAQIGYDPAQLEFVDAELTDLTGDWNIVVPSLEAEGYNQPGYFAFGAFNIEAIPEAGAALYLNFKLLDTENDVELTLSKYSTRESEIMTSGVTITPVILPEEYALRQNYPNPFNPETTLRFDLKEAGHVTLSIYNSSGQKVRTLVDSYMEPGTYSETFNGVDDSGRESASGIYFYQIRCNNFTAVKKMVFIK